VRRALLLFGVLSSACFLPGFEKIEGTGGAGGSGGEPPVCETITFPESTNGDSEPNDPVDFFTALRIVDLGETSLAARPGFDLDAVCTCCLSCEQTATCDPPLGSQGEECDSVDGVSNLGRDNNLAKFLATSVSGPVGLSSTALRSAADAGSWTLLIRVYDYNGLPDDKQVSIAVYTTLGAMGAPVWNGNDVFQVRSDSVAVASLDIDQPLVSNADAYVSDGMLVGVFGSARPLVLHLDNAFTVELSYAVLQARIEQDGADLKLSDGVIGGIWDMRAVFEALAGARVGELPRMCTDNVAYAGVKEALCVLRDSLDAPQPVTCGGISFGMGFSASPIATPTLVDELIDVSMACTPQTNPTNDLCE